MRALDNNYDCKLLCREIQQEEFHPEEASPGGCRCLYCTHRGLPLTNFLPLFPLSSAQVLTREREEALVKQKEESDNLIHSIFPKAIAENLIAKQAQEHTGAALDQATSMERLNNSALDSTLACMHQSVTILFTDIVGFTSMSQTCLPFEVMSFLHNLFTAFDGLVDMDSDLWKVETIGDAFMLASGLGVTSSDAPMRETVVNLEYRLYGKDNDNSGTSTSTSTKTVLLPTTTKKSLKDQGKNAAFHAARAAIIFGQGAVSEALTHCMPNGKMCKIRAGVHTGDVCSGVVGSRMPRYCLFGDTVNTASRIYIPLLLTPIPFSATLEIMSIFLLVLVVIIPTVKGGWNEFSIARIEEVTTNCPEQGVICTPYFRKSITSSAFLLSSMYH